MCCPDSFSHYSCTNPEALNPALAVQPGPPRHSGYALTPWYRRPTLVPMCVIWNYLTSVGEDLHHQTHEGYAPRYVRV